MPVKTRIIPTNLMIEKLEPNINIEAIVTITAQNACIALTYPGLGAILNASNDVKTKKKIAKLAINNHDICLFSILSSDFVINKYITQSNPAKPNDMAFIAAVDKFICVSFVIAIV